ncbi:hypothetical protein HDZ31DRAFT_59851 [Schizophyllum fasciatum]
MDEDDPRRHGLATCCAEQLDTWLDEIADPTGNDASPKDSATPATLARVRRRFLEEYFKMNAYPTMADKKALAVHEGASYRQIHVWFQNRRARAKAQNMPLQKCDLSPEMSATLLERALYAAAAYDDDEESDDSIEEEYWGNDTQPTQTLKRSHAESPRARMKSEFIASSAASLTRRCPSSRSQPVDMDDLIAAFDALNVRGAGTKTVIGADKGYAAREAITYVAPKAPLPSFVPAEMLPYAPPMRSSSLLALDGAPRRKVAGLPKRTPATRTRLTSISSTSSLSSSESSDRLPSLTFSDCSDSSSSSPSPEPPSRIELLPSPPTLAWLDLPSSTLPVVALPPRLLAHDTPALTWREDAGAEGDDEDDLWAAPESNPKIRAQPKIKRSKAGKKQASRVKPRLAGARSTASPVRTSKPEPAPTPATDSAADRAMLAELFGESTTAIIKDGVITFPGWDEIYLSNLDVDPATAGELDIQLGSWDGYGTTTQAAPQFDFGPITTFGGAPSGEAQVQSEPTQAVTQPHPAVEADASFGDADENNWEVQFPLGWDAPGADDMTFEGHFAPSAFDGFLASNWNLEPELEPASNPSTLFGKSGFEASAAPTANEPSVATAPKASSAFTFAADVPETTFSFNAPSAKEVATTPSTATLSLSDTSAQTLPFPTTPTTFTFGSEPSSAPFVFGASTSKTVSAPEPTSSTPSSTSKPTIPSSTTASSSGQSQPAAMQPVAPGPPSSPFAFGSQPACNPFSTTSTSQYSNTHMHSSSCASSSCASSSPFAFGAGSQGTFIFGIS